LLAITLAFPVGIALLAHCEDAPGFAPLGRLSFPLYAVHWPLLQLGRGLKAHVSLPPMVQGFFWIAIAVIAAWGVERFVDRYVRL